MGGCIVLATCWFNCRQNCIFGKTLQLKPYKNICFFYPLRHIPVPSAAIYSVSTVISTCMRLCTIVQVVCRCDFYTHFTISSYIYSIVVYTSKLALRLSITSYWRSKCFGSYRLSSSAVICDYKHLLLTACLYSYCHWWGELRTEMSVTSNRQSKCKLASINSICILCDNDALIVSCFAKLRMKFYTGLQNIVGVLAGSY